MKYLSERACSRFPDSCLCSGSCGRQGRVCDWCKTDEAELLASEENVTEENMEAIAKKAADSFRFGSNMRGSAEYRKHLAYVLAKRGMKALLEGEC